MTIAYYRYHENGRDDCLRFEDDSLEKLWCIAGDKPVMLGVYLMDYSKYFTQMDSALFEKQLDRYFGLIKEGKTEGVIVCSSAVGDAPLDTCRILKEYIEKYGDIEV